MQQAVAPPPASAPPKQVAQALEQLGQAGRLIADVRLGADRLLEALFLVAEKPHLQYSAKCLNLILKEESLMRQHLVNLRAIGKQLEESGVLNDSMRSRSNSWASTCLWSVQMVLLLPMRGSANLPVRLVHLLLTGLGMLILY